MPRRTAASAEGCDEDKDGERAVGDALVPPAQGGSHALQSRAGEGLCCASRWRSLMLLSALAAPAIVAFLARAESRLSLHVALCAGGIAPWTLGQRPPVQLVAHRGCEWPFPENSVPALEHGAKLLKFVELDMALTSDREIVLMHDETVERTTNGTGLLCELSLEQLRALALSAPVDKPAPDTVPTEAVPCPGREGHGCVYRVPTLDAVFDALPAGTRYMLDAKVCFIPGVASSAAAAVPCNSCDGLVRRTKELMEKHSVEAASTVFTSTDVHSLSLFAERFPTASFALSVDHHFAAHTTKQMVRILDRYQFDSVAMYFATAALRPDLVHAIRSSRNDKTGKLRDVYAWTVRRESQARLALCAGVDSLIVADPALWATHAMVRVSSCPDGRP
jgi:glycerophosphoryl diester phosphodiesterase